MADDGVGVRAIEELERENLPEGITLFDGGTAFPALFYQLLEFDKLVVIDATSGGGPIGSVYRFGLEEAAGKTGTLLSLHDLGVVEALRLQGLAHKVPEEIVFFGVEPARVEPSMELSPAIAGELHKLVKMVLRELEESRVQTA